MDGFAATIVQENDHLFALINGQKIQLLAKGVRDYFIKVFDTQMTFVTDRNGRATGLILHEGGVDLYASRIE